MKAYGLTDVGCVRRRNEDSFLIARLDRSMERSEAGYPFEKCVDLTELDCANDGVGQLLIVADGVGGGPGGEVASRTALDVIVRELVHSAPSVEDSASEVGEIRLGLKNAVRLAENELLQVGRDTPSLAGMATTLTLALVIDKHLYLAHVGDSRAYLLRRGQLKRLTRDHNFQQRLRERLGDSLAVNSPLARHLWNVVGGGVTKVDPDLYWMQIEHGDRLLLCTDGLTHTCSDRQLGHILTDEPGIPECVQRLVLRAKGDGGTDNITAILADFQFDADAAAATQTVILGHPTVDPYAETITDFEACLSAELKDACASV